MNKLTEIKFNLEYPSFFLMGFDCYYRDGACFGKIEAINPVLLKQFDQRVNNLLIPNEYIYLFSGRQSCIYDVKINNFFDLEILNNYRVADGSNVSFFRLANKTIPETLLFDIEKRQILWKQDKYFSFQILGDGLLIDNEKNRIVRYDFQTGLPLWQYALSEVEYSQGSNYPPAVSKEVTDILGVYAGVVWIVSDMSHLIGLETETGKCKYHLKTPINQPAEWGNWEVFTPAKKSYFDAEKGTIFGLDHVHYWECDLNNPTESYLHFDISGTSKEKNIVPDFKGNWVSDEIFFGQNSFAQDATYVGIFNRKTRQITWTSRELGEEGVFKGINKVEYQAGRLYVLDRTSTLHIFEDSPA